MKRIFMLLLALVGIAFADDPAWLASVTTELTAIGTMIGGVIVALVSIYMAPIAWSKIKHVLSRG